MYSVYCITNKISGRKYIGSTIDWDRRYKEHLSGQSSNIGLQRDISRIGIENFSFSVMYQSDDERDLREFECSAILAEEPKLLYNGTYRYDSDERNVRSAAAAKAVMFQSLGMYLDCKKCKMVFCTSVEGSSCSYECPEDLDRWLFST